MCGTIIVAHDSSAKVLTLVDISFNTSKNKYKI